MYRTVSNRSGIEQASSNFSILFWFYKPEYSLIQPPISLYWSRKMVANRAASLVMSWRADITEKIKSYLGDYQHASGEGGWKPGWRHEPVPIAYRSKESSKFSVWKSLWAPQIVEKQVAAASTATTTRIGSLPVYPKSSDPGYAGRRSSSKSQMGRSLWLEQEWRLRISCTRFITGSCSRSRLKKSRAHRCIRRCIRVPCQNEHWLCQCCRLFSCVQHRLATPPSILLQNIPKMPKSLPDWPLNFPAKSGHNQNPKWGLSFPSLLSNASNVGYLRSRRPAYHHLVLIIVFLWQIVQFIVCIRLGGHEGYISQ